MCFRFHELQSYVRHASHGSRFKHSRIITVVRAMQKQMSGETRIDDGGILINEFQTHNFLLSDRLRLTPLASSSSLTSAFFICMIMI